MNFLLLLDIFKTKAFYHKYETICNWSPSRNTIHDEHFLKSIDTHNYIAISKHKLFTWSHYELYISAHIHMVMMNFKGIHFLLHKCFTDTVSSKFLLHSYYWIFRTTISHDMKISIFLHRHSRLFHDFATYNFISWMQAPAAQFYDFHNHRYTIDTLNS